MFPLSPFPGLVSLVLDHSGEIRALSEIIPLAFVLFGVFFFFSVRRGKEGRKEKGKQKGRYRRRKMGGGGGGGGIEGREKDGWLEQAGLNTRLFCTVFVDFGTTIDLKVCRWIWHDSRSRGLSVDVSRQQI